MIGHKIVGLIHFDKQHWSEYSLLLIKRIAKIRFFSPFSFNKKKKAAYIFWGSLSGWQEKFEEKKTTVGTTEQYECISFTSN